MKYLKGASPYIVVIIVITLLIFITIPISNSQISYSSLLNEIEVGNVESLELEGNKVTVKLRDSNPNLVDLKSKSVLGDQVFSFVPNIESFVDSVIQDEKIESINYSPPAPEGILSSTILPTIFFIVIVVVIWFFIMQQSQGGGGSRVMSFGKSKAKLAVEDKRKTTFDDVAGADEEKEELEEIVEFLKKPAKFTELGARIPKGVLLVGPPGTGKTLLAKAVSGEAGVPFFTISGSDFVEMFVGVGASRVRDLFEQAKKSAPCIIFIDEIDAVGRRRGAGLGGGHDEREQTLNQLLVEMDGFGLNEGVIILAATNRPDILDPALLRPGRFDRRVVVGLPDIKGRKEILEVHSKDKPLDESVDLADIAKGTPGFTGADLENLLNESALLSARKDKKAISGEEIKEATFKVIMGPEKRSRVINPKEKKLTAYHEAGHAIAVKLASSTDKVDRVSIIPVGLAGGYTAYKPQEDVTFQTKGQLIEKIIIALSGRAAEEIILGEISTGASGDLKTANGVARSMITKYGMSKDLNNLIFGEDNDEVFIGRSIGQGKNYSEEVASKIDSEVKSIIDDAYSSALKILNDNVDLLHKIASSLMEREKIEGHEFELLFEGKELLTDSKDISLEKKDDDSSSNDEVIDKSTDN